MRASCSTVWWVGVLFGMVTVLAGLLIHRAVWEARR